MMKKMSALALALGMFAAFAASAQDAVFVAPNGYVGLGTSTPSAPLHLFCSAANESWVSFGPNSFEFNVGYAGTTFGRGAGFLNVRPDASAVAPNPSIRFLTVNLERMIITNAGNIGVGTTAPTSRFHVNGGDIRVSGGSFVDDGVTLNAPDYVFDPAYALTPLPELKEYIERERHLPNIPRAAEIKTNGLKLGQFQMLLLEKVEELTLHTIRQNEEIESLRSRNAELEARVEREQGLDAELRARVAALERALAPSGSESP